MPITLKHFYMIRHGETEHNAKQIMAGSTDSKLTERGITQARKTQTILESLSIKPQAIIHSHLSRARDTANILNEVLNVPLHEDPDLSEWHAGDWEGVHYDECPDLLEKWIDPPGGETLEQFLTRTKRGKNKALALSEQPIMIVCHGGVFRAFGKLYGLDSPGVDNCTLYEFKPDPSKTQFPWDIWAYRTENETVREPSMIYYAPIGGADEMAS